MCLYFTVSRTRRERRPHLARLYRFFSLICKSQGSQNSELGRCQDGSSDSKEAWRSWNYKITQTHSLVAIHGHSKTMSSLDIFTNGSLWFISRIEWHFFTLVGLPSLGSPLTSWTGWVFNHWWTDGLMDQYTIVYWLVDPWSVDGHLYYDIP